ncbi:MAG: TIGR03560 family F420-dependent LLM class oxidoreductase [Dehalococcoidia bacterium]|nr:TIGR03560 family F420-dependent LLM class oxidoreductase [Dehalococcoidia bacterium]
MLFSVKPRLHWPFAQVLELSQYVEATGWDGIWIADHLINNNESGEGLVGECWTITAALAALVPRVRLGTIVVGNTLRHPAIHAKMASQIDVISGGRFILGIGAGWQENEHQAYGIPFYTLGERSGRLEEAAAVISSLFKQERTTFEGRYYQLVNAPLQPRPVQQPLPLLIGGVGERRTLRAVARYANEWNAQVPPDVFAQKSRVLDRHCADVGRDPSEIHRSVQTLVAFSDNPAQLERAGARGAVLAGTPQQLCEAIERYADAGADEIVIPDFNLATLEEKKATYDRLMDEVVPHFR